MLLNQEIPKKYPRNKNIRYNVKIYLGRNKEPIKLNMDDSFILI